MSLPVICSRSFFISVQYISQASNINFLLIFSLAKYLLTTILNSNTICKFVFIRTFKNSDRASFFMSQYILYILKNQFHPYVKINQFQSQIIMSTCSEHVVSLPPPPTTKGIPRTRKSNCFRQLKTACEIGRDTLTLGYRKTYSNVAKGGNHVPNI